MSATRMVVSPTLRGVHVDAARLFVGVLGAAIVFFTATGAALIVAADAAVGWTGYETADVAVFLLAFPALPVMGAVLALRRPGNPIGWVFLVAALGLAISAFAHGYGDYAIDARPGSLPAADMAAWWGWTGWAAFGLLAVLVPLLFPDGRLPSPRWKPVVLLGMAAVAAETVVVALRAGDLVDFPGIANPFGIARLDGLFDAVERISRPIVPAALVAGLISLVIRYGRGDSKLRQQLKWLGYATGIIVAADVVGNLALGGGLNDHPAVCTWGTTATKPVYGTVVPVLLYAGLPVAVAVAVLRHNLYDIDRLIRRSAVYAVLWTAIALSYTGVAWALGVAVTGRLPVTAGVLVTIVVTLVFQPARRRLERAADHWSFGRRPSGYELASGFGATVVRSGGLDELATSLAEIVRRGLVLRWARVRLELPTEGSSGVAEAVAGNLPGGADPDLTVPVTCSDQRVGLIECGPALDLRRSAENRALLELLAHEAALAVHNLALARALAGQVETVEAQAAELVASRARIVRAQDAERRRVERDIHDGAQQELVAMMAKLRLARELVGQTPHAAVQKLDELQRDAQSALRGIRDLAQGIYPSVLEDEGLVAAIEDRTARLPLEVGIVTDQTVRASRFPNAIEAAAFFVVSEALANVLKHAGASRATVAVHHTNGSLTVEVHDDGYGFDPAERTGDGLPHLADRVGALGGVLHLHSSPGAGATVTAVLPVTSLDQ